MPRTIKKNPDNWREWFCSEETLRVIVAQPHRLGWLIGREKLNDIHSDWIRYCWDTNEPRALQSFRGGYKTTAVDIVGSIRWMLFHPNDRIAIIRKSFSEAANVTDAISAAMALPQIREIFKYCHGEYPKPTRDRHGDIKYNFYTAMTPEGNITAKGIDQKITGAHFDKIICDDIITLKDRVSRAERDRTVELVREIATNIIEPGKGSAWIGTPWHREDAWTIINTFSEIAKYPLSQYNFIGKKEAEQKRLTTTPYLFHANYELELQSDEAALFSEPVYRRGWDYAIPGAMAQLDAAYDGTHYCALTIAVPIKTGGEHDYYQAAGFTYAGNVKNWIPEIARLCKKYRVQYIYVEKNADKGYTADKLKEAGLRVQEYAEVQNKHLKISTHLFDAWRYLEWAPETDDEYMAQILDYREGSTPDDAPDSAASLFREAYPATGDDYSELYKM